MSRNLTKALLISRMFEEGARLKQERGAGVSRRMAATRMGTAVGCGNAWRIRRIASIDRRRRGVPPAGEEGVATLGWHVIGSVASERVSCLACGHVYDADDDAIEAPVFRRLIAEISRLRVRSSALTALGKRLYAQALSHD